MQRVRTFLEGRGYFRREGTHALAAVRLINTFGPVVALCFYVGVVGPWLGHQVCDEQQPLGVGYLVYWLLVLAGALALDLANLQLLTAVPSSDVRLTVKARQLVFTTLLYVVWTLTGPNQLHCLPGGTVVDVLLPIMFWLVNGAQVLRYGWFKDDVQLHVQQYLKTVGNTSSTLHYELDGAAELGAGLPAATPADDGHEQLIGQ
jgi:hypothetical protein